ncbi:MAG: hypothetical protein GXO76_01710 [Calditrichaeota bacterium]|nr:hypothetical protein [Calditrichota bacterium]
MKRLWLLFLVVTTGWISNAHSQPVGYLHLTAAQLPAKLFVDSLSVPPARDTLLALSPGTHRIRATTPFRADWLLRDFQRSVRIKALDTTTVAIVFPRYFFLSSQPEGAFVRAANAVLGRTPLLANWETLKNTPVRLEKRGYLSRQIRLQNPNEKRLIIRLKKDPGYWKRFNQLLQKKRLQRKRLRWGAAGTGGAALASGVAAYFLKKKANAAYDTYLKTPFPDKIQTYYNRAQRYDTYAGTTYLIFEINLISSAILLLLTMGK